MLIFALAIILTIVVSIMGSNTTNKSLSLIYGLSMMVGFIWYCLNLSKFADIQTNEENRSSVNTVLVGNILLVVGSIIATFVASFFLATLIRINASAKAEITAITIVPILLISLPSYLAYRKMEKGYRELSQSQTFSPKCQNGFKKLRQSATLKKLIVLTYFALSCICIYLLMNVSSDTGLLNTIDKITGILAIAGLAIFILGIVALVKWFIGWGIVKNNGPEETEEETTY